MGDLKNVFKIDLQTPTLRTVGNNINKSDPSTSKDPISLHISAKMLGQNLPDPQAGWKEAETLAFSRRKARSAIRDAILAAEAAKRTASKKSYALLAKQQTCTASPSLESRWQQATRRKQAAQEKLRAASWQAVDVMLKTMPRRQNSARHSIVHRLFRIVDQDVSGTIGMNEFLDLLQVLDNTLTLNDVLATFQAIGATDSLDEAQLHKWCDTIFGKLSDTDFVSQFEDLINGYGEKLWRESSMLAKLHKASSDTAMHRPVSKIGDKMRAVQDSNEVSGISAQAEGPRATAALELFERIDSNLSGAIEADELLRMLQVHTAY